MGYQVIPSEIIHQEPLQRYNEKVSSRARLNNIQLAVVLAVNLVAIAIIVGGAYLFKAGCEAADNCFQKAGCWRTPGANWADYDGGWRCNNAPDCADNASQVGGSWMEFIGGSAELGAFVSLLVVLIWKRRTKKMNCPENIIKVRELLLDSLTPAPFNDHYADYEKSILIDLGIFPKEFEKPFQDLVTRYKALIARRIERSTERNDDLKQDLQKVIEDEAALAKESNELAADWNNFQDAIKEKLLNVDEHGNSLAIIEL